MATRLFVVDNDNNSIIDGGDWSINIFDLFNLPNTEISNAKRARCTAEGNQECYMCSCYDYDWYKVTIDMLKQIDDLDKDVLNDNCNIISSFIIDDDDWWKLKTEDRNNLDFLFSKNHRDFVWMNIS